VKEEKHFNVAGNRRGFINWDKHWLFRLKNNLDLIRVENDDCFMARGGIEKRRMREEPTQIG
jgi:hypothetical protein